MYKKIQQLIDRIRQTRPLILNITNYVTMDFIANGLLSLGASPIMTNSVKEMEDLVHIASSIVINMGTLDDKFISISEQACILANQIGKPLLFDPVGAGASQYRTQTALDFIKRFRFSIIRANASEIMALSGSHTNKKGVDAAVSSLDVIEPAKSLSSKYDVVVSMSGKTDVIVKRERVQFFDRGSSMVPIITGSGCLLTSVSSAFNAEEQDGYTAACAAALYYSVCGENAAKHAGGPASFKMHFLDEISKFPKECDYETI